VRLAMLLLFEVLLPVELLVVVRLGVDPEVTVNVTGIETFPRLVTATVIVAM